MRTVLTAAALVGLVVLGRPSAIETHTTSTGLATITVTGATVTYRLTILLGELPVEAAQMLAAAADGDQASVERAALELRRRVTVRAGDAPCLPGRALIQGSRLGDGRVTVESTIQCPAPPIRLGIRDDWFDLFGEHYRTIARIDAACGKPSSCPTRAR